MVDSYALPKKEIATAQQVTGEVLFKKKGKGQWRRVKVGTKITEADVLRTMVESNVQLVLESGSTVSLEENTVVKLSELVKDGKKSTSKVDIKRGKILFNVKKLTASKSKFTFETLTATAAIRGTIGSLSFGKGGTVASLEEGKLELKSDKGGKSVTIGANQIAIQSDKGFEVKTVKNKNELLKTLETLEKDTTTVYQVTLSDSVKAELQEFVSDTVDILPDSLESTVEDSLNNPPPVLEDTTSQTEINDDETELVLSVTEPGANSFVKGTSMNVSGYTAIGAIISIGAASVISEDGTFNLTVPLSQSDGPFILEVQATLENQKLSQSIPLNYGDEEEVSIPTEIILETSENQNINNGILNIRGRYTGKNANLTLKALNKTYDLTSKSQTFSLVLPITDNDGTWNLEEVSLDLKSDDGEDSKQINVEVDKTSKSVNTLPPKLSVAMQDNSGYAVVNVEQVSGDLVNLIVRRGDELEERELNYDLRNFRVELLPAENDYEIEAVDQAGNSVKRSFKGVAYYPKAQFKVEISSKYKNRTLRLPPKFSRISSHTPTERITIRIKNLPDDNYRFIKRITVAGNDGIIHELKNTDIDDVIYDLEVELERGTNNQFVVEVEPHNGSIERERFNIKLLE